MARVLQDVFFKQAKAEGYLARSAFKLLELQSRHRIIPRGGAVLDLGCYPGAWLQVASEAVGHSGCLVGIDLTACKVPKGLSTSNVHVLQVDAQDVEAEDLVKLCPGRGFSTVLSDMCHATIGSAAADVARSLDLAYCAASIAIGLQRADDANYEPTTAHEGVLQPGGNMVVKLLEGSGVNDFSLEVRPFFRKTLWSRPKATRKMSREVYLVALGRKGI